MVLFYLHYILTCSARTCSVREGSARLSLSRCEVRKSRPETGSIEKRLEAGVSTRE